IAASILDKETGRPGDKKHSFCQRTSSNRYLKLSSSPCPRVFLSLGRRMLVHELGQPRHVLDRRLGEDAVPEVEDVPRAAGGALENIGGAALDLGPGSEQHVRVEIALDRMP